MTPCTFWLRLSPAPRSLGNHSVCDSFSHPASSNVAAAPNATRKNCRRAGSRPGFMTFLRDNPKASCDHRAQVIPESADDDFEDVHQDEGDQQPRDREMDGARRLPPADD